MLQHKITQIWAIILLSAFLNGFNSDSAISKTHFQVITIDSCLNIWPSFVVACGNYSTTSKLQIVIKKGEVLSIMNIYNGLATEDQQFTFKGQILNVVNSNLDDDTFDEIIFLLKNGAEVDLVLIGYGDNEQFFKLKIDDIDSLGKIDLVPCLLQDAGNKFFIGAVRTYKPSNGPRLLFGLELGEKPVIKWVKRIKESFETEAFALRTDSGEVAVFGGHATLNTLFYDGQIFIDDYCTLRAINRNGDEIARIDKQIRHPYKPQESGYFHCFVQVPYLPDPQRPIIAALWGSIEYKEVNGIISSYLLDLKQRKWIEIQSKSFPIDNLLSALPLDAKGNWQFLSKKKDSLRLQLLKFNPIISDWTISPKRYSIKGDPQKIIRLHSNLNNQHLASLAILKDGYKKILEVIDCSSKIEPKVLAEYEGCLLLKSSNTDLSIPQDFVVAINEPLTSNPEFSDKLVGTRKVYWNRIILTQANPVVKTSAIVLIVGGVLMMAFAFILYLNFKKGGEHRVGGLKKWQISPAFIERIKIKLQKAMVEDEIYMNEDIRYDESKFTLDYLAGAINEKKYLVSLVLNLEYKNFNDFANRYKIEKVKMMLTDPEFEHYSIEGIGQEVGFKSSSTFYKAFKNYTGITPQEFRKTAK